MFGPYVKGFLQRIVYFVVIQILYVSRLQTETESNFPISAREIVFAFNDYTE